MTRTIALPQNLTVPARLVRTLHTWPDQDEIDRDWLDALPAKVADLAARWDISFERHIPESTVTLVLLGHSPKLGPVVFKSSPITDEFRAEAATLEFGGGASLSRLYDLDNGHNAMIVERIVPGDELKAANLPDDEATRIFATLALQLWSPVPNTVALHPIRRWMRDLFTWTSCPDRLPDATIARARAIADELLIGTMRDTLVHGDLHHANILRDAERGWMAIDPKGVRGDPAFEIAAWLYNPPGISDHPDLPAITARRIAQCAAIWDMEPQHLVRWGFVGAVLSAVWSAGGFGEDDWWRSSLCVAQIVEAMLD